MPMSSKFLTESTGEKIVKIGQYLAKIWTKYNSLVFFGPPCRPIKITIHCDLIIDFTASEKSGRLTS